MTKENVLAEPVYQPSRWSAWWLVTAVALLALGPLFLLAGIAIGVSTDATRTNVDRSVRGTAAASATVVGEHLEGLTSLVESFSVRSSLRNGLTASDEGWAQEILVQLYHSKPEVELAFIADSGGELLAILPETPSIIGQSFAYRDWYRGVLETDATYLSEAYQTAATGEQLVVAAASPVHAVDPKSTCLADSDPSCQGRLVGLIVAGVHLTAIQRYIEDYSRAQGVSITVTDQRGVIVAQTGHQPTSLVSIADDPRIAGALRGEASSGTRDTSVVAYAPVPSIGWAVVTEIPTAVALRSADEVRTAIVASTAMMAALVVAGLATMLIQRRRRSIADDQLRQTSALLDAIIDNHPDLILVKDADLRFVHINGAVTRMLGYTNGELVGKSSEDLSIGLSLAGDRTVLDSGQSISIPTESIETSEHGRRLLHTKKIPIIGSAGTAPYLLQISRDVTDRHLAEQQLLDARNAAEQANSAKNQFLSKMSHELRTPLNAIIGFSQLLEQDNLDPEQHENVSLIHRGGKHLLGMINEILDITLIESGHMGISLEPVRLGEVVERSLELVRPAALDRKLQFPEANFPLCSDHETYVYGDRRRLEQVLLNLLSNAVKYNREDGSVEVSCNATAAGRVRVSIADTGPGIADDQLDLLFTPFQRLGAEFTTVEGTGLGLAIAYGLVDSMGGEIGVDSILGEGATFWIELDQAHNPIEQVPMVPGSDLNQHAVTTPADSKRLLYIEDNPSNIRLVERILASDPTYELIIAMNGGSGIELAQQHRPDLILLDLHLPDMNGEELLERLRLQPTTRAIPVIVVSADATQLHIDHLLAAGADGYLTKPIDVAQFKTHIERQLNRNLAATNSHDEPTPDPPPGHHDADADIDHDVVRQLAELFTDPVDIDEFLQTVLHDYDTRLDALQNAIDTGNIDQIRQDAHFLKGTAGTFGAVRTARLSHQIEQQPDADADELRKLVDELRHSFEDAHRQLAHELSNPGT